MKNLDYLNKIKAREEELTKTSKINTEYIRKKKRDATLIIKRTLISILGIIFVISVFGSLALKSISTVVDVENVKRLDNTVKSMGQGNLNDLLPAELIIAKEALFNSEKIYTIFIYVGTVSIIAIIIVHFLTKSSNKKERDSQ